MKPSSWDKQLGLVSPRERAASQSDQTNTPSKNKVRNEVGLDVSHHARISQRGGEMPFFLDILFHRTSEIGIFRQLSGDTAQNVESDLTRLPCRISANANRTSL